MALIDSATTSHPPLPSPILTLSLNHDIEFKGCQIVSDMKLHTGGITTGNCFEFELRFSGTGLSVVEEPYRRPCFYTACHSSESRSGEQAGWHLLQQLPKKTATWGLSEALYGPSYPASNCAGKGNFTLDKHYGCLLNNRVYCLVVVWLQCRRSILQERSSDTCNKLRWCFRG